MLEEEKEKERNDGLLFLEIAQNREGWKLVGLMEYVEVIEKKEGVKGRETEREYKNEDMK